LLPPDGFIFSQNGERGSSFQSIFGELQLLLQFSLVVVHLFSIVLKFIDFILRLLQNGHLTFQHNIGFIEFALQLVHLPFLGLDLFSDHCVFLNSFAPLRYFQHLAYLLHDDFFFELVLLQLVVQFEQSVLWDAVFFELFQTGDEVVQFYQHLLLHLPIPLNAE
jgi:hypothetical protein